MSELVDKIPPSVYTILADKLGFTYAGDGLWKDKDNRLWMQTKHGFVSGENYNYKLKYEQIFRDLSDLNDRYIIQVKKNKECSKEINYLENKCRELSAEPGMGLNEKEKRTLLSILKSKATPEQKVKEAIRFLNP